MYDEPIGAFLDDLASAAPVPGGGAAAALSAALGAALVSMVCNLTIGQEKFRAHEATMQAALAEATELRARALELAAQDGEAFGGLRAAYALPRASSEEKAARQTRIQQGLVAAAEVPLRTAALAARLVALCAEILPGGNPNVVSDVGVAVLSARAALDGAALNVRINLALIRDAAFTERVGAELARLLDEARPLAERVARDVEARIGR